MSENRLNIVSISDENASPLFTSNTLRNAKIKELQAKFERLWLKNPEQFDPYRNCMEEERVERIWQLLTKHMDPKEKHAVDIGCGSGIFSEKLLTAGASAIIAIDIAENALKKIQAKNHPQIDLKWGAMPDIALPDQICDIIVCTELIGEIPKEDYRLFFAELARLIRSNGILICSSSIDIYSERGVEKLNELAQTEFDLIDTLKSYHGLYIRLKKLLNAPYLFTEGWANSNFRKNQLEKRRGLNRGWYWINTTPLFVWLWYSVHPLIKPLQKIFKNNKKLLLLLERINRFIWDEEGVSHYIFIAKRRSFQTIDSSEIPISRPGKREVWE